MRERERERERLTLKHAPQCARYSGLIELSLAAFEHLLFHTTKVGIFILSADQLQISNIVMRYYAVLTYTSFETVIQLHRWLIFATFFRFFWWIRGGILQLKGKPRIEFTELDSLNQSGLFAFPIHNTFIVCLKVYMVFQPIYSLTCTLAELWGLLSRIQLRRES